MNPGFATLIHLSTTIVIGITMGCAASSPHHHHIPCPMFYITTITPITPITPIIAVIIHPWLSIYYLQTLY